ncbi:acetyl-CoA carboxylase biotin carboxyl carrier protein subunit [Oceanobacillus alkalisoli]|uniref:acetyl-CoA carboxylase biotin carboxyl carrier protein subunit n=1 Tax=Oceanobacillus alkalisoli TaxID=2925113 RepID=UPI001EE3A763|nr:acetyl-CoA carboxylase biotin carboxyl carrier protein subunit [Oceanobacillus alkalisoli]MCG5103223.1 acetyl-CoA carboxylase biotin carboxyl carrier protein subunit [Oceanobacillus alkalisoli]
MNTIISNIAGTVWKVNVTENERLEKDQTVIILESMKMEMPITSSVKGTVKEVRVNEGDFVNEGDILIQLY